MRACICLLDLSIGNHVTAVSVKCKSKNLIWNVFKREWAEGNLKPCKEQQGNREMGIRARRESGIIVFKCGKRRHLLNFQRKYSSEKRNEKPHTPEV